MAIRRAFAAMCAGAFLWAGSGCGGAPPEKFVPVAGKVTLDGDTLTVGAVSFRPDASRGNASMHVPTGSIDTQGNYELTTIGRKGAPPGWYRVLVFADANAVPTGTVPHPLPPRWMMNVKYTDEKITDLFVEVVELAQPGAYDLNLTR
jgi:hypothetical protein